VTASPDSPAGGDAEAPVPEPDVGAADVPAGSRPDSGAAAGGEAASGRAGLLDSARFAFGTLTVLPVRVARWDRAAARGGMAAAPLVGLAVGAAAGGAGWVLADLGGGPLLAAVAAVAVPAVLTRGLHLDGLADTADGLGSGKPPEQALAVMKRSDIGPFGVVTLLLVLLAQTAALAGAYGLGRGHGLAAALVAATTGRAAMALACRRGVPAARPGGLGAAVAEVLVPRTAWTAAAVCTVLAAAVGLALPGLGWLHLAVAAAAGLLAAEALLARCRSRFGGVTGDVFGALGETAATAVLVLAALR